jgi:hypothetical protein
MRQAEVTYIIIIDKARLLCFKNNKWLAIFFERIESIKENLFIEGLERAWPNYHNL